jgi:pimeloyl-ACP methyl ester carboxylesterase
MIEPTLNYVPCPDVANGVAGSHRMAYWSWGNPAHAHVVVCVHGISRQGRDFDTLAKALIGPGGQRCRVVCVDIAGRGHSDAHVPGAQLCRGHGRTAGGTTRWRRTNY